MNKITVDYNLYPDKFDHATVLMGQNNKMEMRIVTETIMTENPVTDGTLTEEGLPEVVQTETTNTYLELNMVDENALTVVSNKLTKIEVANLVQLINRLQRQM